MDFSREIVSFFPVYYSGILLAGWAQILGWVFGGVGGLIGRADLWAGHSAPFRWAGWAQPIPLSAWLSFPLRFFRPVNFLSPLDSPSLKTKSKKQKAKSKKTQKQKGGKKCPREKN